MLQSAQMFVGEAGCWLVVAVMAIYRRLAGRRQSGYEPVSAADDGTADDAASINSEHPLIGNGTNKRGSARPDGVLRGIGILLLSLPAICDICGTTLMNAGLLMVAASIYQMTRGALVLFVGLFSVIFLRRRLYLFQWLSLMGVMLGVAVVGLAGAIWPDKLADKAGSLAAAAGILPPLKGGAEEEALRVVIGVGLIAGAQIFTAIQFVLEEFLLERSSIEPLQVVGWEGLFGLTVTVVVMLVLHVTIGSTDDGRYGMFDMAEGYRQMTEYPEVWISSVLIMVSIG